MTLALLLATPVTTLALIGGGEFSFGETREIDEILVARIPSERKVVAFLPTASGSAEYAAHFGTYLRTIDPAIEVRNVPVYRGRDVRRQKNIDAIRSAGMIYIGGGVTNALLEAIRESATEMALREAAAGGAVVAAIGAGAASFGVHSRDMRGGAALTGLGWLQDAVVDAGFDPSNDTALRRLMSLPDVRIGIGIPAKTALLIGADGVAEVAGSGQIAAFRKQ